MNEKMMLRERVKAKKPHFVRQDAHRFVKKMGEVWRKPRGHHSKMRLSRKGKAAMVKMGYRGPVATRGMTNEGRIPLCVHNKKDLEKLDPTVHEAIIGASVSKRKRYEIIIAAQQRGIAIFNIKDASKYKEHIEKEMSERKKARAQLTKFKEKKVEEKKKVEKKEKTLESATKEEDAKEKEVQRREAEKVMIQK